MGPIASTKGYDVGALVCIKSRVGTFSNRHLKTRPAENYGTIIDVYVNINIKTGKREENILVLWGDNLSNWMPISNLTLV